LREVHLIAVKEIEGLNLRIEKSIPKSGFDAASGQPGDGPDPFRRSQKVGRTSGTLPGTPHSGAREPHSDLVGPGWTSGIPGDGTGF
jgi:hypothetical protein